MSIASNFPAIAPSLNLSFALTKALDPRITFTRASTATYYGTETAKAEENLLLQSQTFETTWSQTNATVTADTTTAPDGTTTADTLTDNATSAPHFITLGSVIAVDTTYTCSCFLKAGTSSFAILTINEAATSQRYFMAEFDLSTGAVNRTQAGSSGTLISSSIVSVGNGWYRCVIIGQVAAIGTSRVVIGVSDGTSAINTFGQVSYVGTGSDIYAWGAQLEQRSAVTNYTPTTTQTITNYIPVLESQASGVARFDHNPTTFDSLGLLIEESRTNLLLRSEEFDNAAWTKSRASVTANTIVAPDGTLTGDKLVEDTTASNTHQCIQNITVTNGTTVTATVYAKAGERTRFQFFNPGSNTQVIFDLLTGAVISSGAGVVSASAANVGNGWYRCQVTSVSDGTTNQFTLIRLVQSGTTTSYTGDGFSGIFIWGAQLEAGAFATSYIPTVASQVTRAADAASMTGANFSSWYNAAAGTLYAEAATPSFATTYVFADINDGSVSNFIRQSTASNATNTQFVIQEAGVTTASPGVVVSIGSNRKMAGAYAINSVQQSVNGLLGTEDTIATIPSGVSQMNIGARPTGVNLVNSTIRKIAYYPIRVTDTQLQALTS